MPDAPRSIGGFRILGELGRGGMGVVYEAHDDRLDRRVAVKAVDLGRVGPRGRERARREARALARLSHPNVVQVFEVGEDGAPGTGSSAHGGTTLFLVMEHVEGLTLRRWQAAEPRPWREVLEMYRQVAAGLAAAHDKGLVHRDFKPDNAIIGTDGRVRVLDFGLACAQRDPTARSRGPIAGRGSDQVTEQGVVMGTPAYMAPEQFMGEPLDARTDQFALCVSLFEALYGRRPFQGQTRLALLDAITAGPPVLPPGARNDPPWVLAALMRGLQVDPSRRFPDMRALKTALGGPQRPRRWMAVGLAVAVVGVGAWAKEPPATACAEAAVQRWQTGWSPERREAVTQALARVPVPYAEHSSARVIEVLDDYGADWVEEHAAACTSAGTPRAPEPMDRRTRCLADGQRRFVALVDALAGADATVAEHALQAAGELPPVARCADEPRGAELVAPPLDPALAHAAEALRGDLDQVITRYHTGQHVAAHELAVTVAHRARSQDDRSLRAEVGLWLGHTQDAMGDHDAAAQTLRTAFFEARTAGADELAARIATRLVFEEGYHLHHHETADSWAKHARAGLERLGGDPFLEPRLDMAMAHVESARGRYEAARVGYERAAEGFVAQYGPEAPAVALAISNVATAEQLLGSHEAALTHNLRALEMNRAILGPSHPEVSRVLSNIGAVYLNTGRLDEALAHFEASLAILEEQFDPHHPDIISTRSNIAAAHWQRRDIDRALEEQRRIVTLRREHLGNDHLEVATALTNMAGSLLWLERRAEARSALLRALAIFEQQLAPDHPEVGRTLHNLAMVELELGEDAALEHCRRALTIRERRLPRWHYDRSTSYSLLASILGSRGERSAARDAAMKALDIREHGTVPSIGFLASARMKVAQLSWELGDDRAAAHAMAQRARDEFSAAGDDWAPEHAEALEWLEQHPTPPPR